MRSKFAKLLFYIALILVCVVAAYFLANWLFTTVPIEGPSMEPTIHDGDTVILYKQGKYERGDIVIFNTHKLDPDGKERYYVKRIIALGGDTVEIKADSDGIYRIYVNGEAVDEPYLGEGIPSARAVDASAPVTVPEGQFYFCGDNRLNSEDSRSGLLCNVDDIVGRVILRYVQDDGIGDIGLIKRPYAVESAFVAA